MECIDLNRPSSHVGAALALGFVVMLLVDRIGGGHKHGHDEENHHHGGNTHESMVELQSLHGNKPVVPHHHSSDLNGKALPDTVPSQHFSQSATVGILVHSAIDGLALGAISVAENQTLELVRDKGTKDDLN